MPLRAKRRQLSGDFADVRMDKRTPEQTRHLCPRFGPTPNPLHTFKYLRRLVYSFVNALTFYPPQYPLFSEQDNREFWPSHSCLASGIVFAILVVEASAKPRGSMDANGSIFALEHLLQGLASAVDPDI